MPHQTPSTTPQRTLPRSKLFVAAKRMTLQKHPEMGSISHFRHRLGIIIESKNFQYAIIGLIFLDLLVLTAELLLMSEASRCKPENGKEEIEPENKTVATAEHVLMYISWGILILFLIEILLSMVAFGERFFRNPFYVIDLVIVLAAFLIEVILRSTLASLLVILRLWRIIRIVHSVLLMEQEKVHHSKKDLEDAKEEIIGLRKALAKYEPTSVEPKISV